MQSHPALVDGFVTTARHEYLLSLPLTKEDIKAEAVNILCKFQDAREPNSPSRTHYIAQISPDFLARAKTKDTDRLMAMLPFQSLSFSTLEGRRGDLCSDLPRREPLSKAPAAETVCAKEVAGTVRRPQTAR